jgi:hypothetical protein
VRRLVLLILVGCSSSASAPDASITFEYSATVGWSPQSTPDVTSVAVDGYAVVTGTFYTVHDSYASFEAAQASFTDHDVVVKTTTNMTYTFHIEMSSCGGGTPMFDAPIVKETDNFSVYPDLNDASSLDFYADSGSCESNDGHVVAWTSRTP